MLNNIINIKYRVFSHDVTAAMLVYQTNPVGAQLFSYVDTFFSKRFAWLLVTRVKTLYCYTMIYTKARVLLEFFSSFSPPTTLAVKASHRLFTSSTSLVTMTTSLLIDSSWHTPIKASDMDERFCNTGRLFSRSSRNACRERATIQFIHRIVENNNYCVLHTCLEKTLVQQSVIKQSEHTLSFQPIRCLNHSGLDLTMVSPLSADYMPSTQVSSSTKGHFTTIS